ncbi:MAG: glucose-6-phosphate dehydrogenase [Archangium sp.]|nr:glucose-6-phosphate dehydrogenase [Archangium sp.]MDP3571311.1 glucose-6-phosphate dehydrogenase [Archangium sp.]
MIERLLILGTGDLTSRYLLPALAWLEDEGKLPAALRITAVGRREHRTPGFRAVVGEGLQKHCAKLAASSREALVRRIDYLRAEVTQSAALAPLVRDEPVAAYLALPPSVFGPAALGLARAGVREGSRIVLEKPFGESLASARALNRLLHEHFAEDMLFRVDHFLAYQTVRNILGLRFANGLLASVWDRAHIERVDIVWDETLGLEGRASYYDGVGALKDVLQNHLLQLACLVGMEPPLSLDARALRDRRLDFLRSVRQLSSGALSTASVRGRYTAGTIDGRELPAYADEPGVDPRKMTETFAQLTLAVDSGRWAGVPFVLRTGKALGHARQEISLSLRDVPVSIFGVSGASQNVLRIGLERERVGLTLNLTGPERSPTLRAVSLEADLTQEALPAYARILLDVLEGRSTLSIRADEAEEAWRIVEPVVDAWRSGAVPLLEYAAGSTGPSR